MRHQRQEVVARTKAEFARLDEVVQRLTPADWRRRVPRPEGKDPWTVKDALAHIVYWKEHSARVFRGEPRLPEIRGLEVPAINRLVYERWRRRPPGEVAGYHRRVQEDVLRTLAARPDDWFSARERGKDWPGDFDAHSAHHRVKDIEAAIDAVADRLPVSGRKSSPRSRAGLRR